MIYNPCMYDKQKPPAGWAMPNALAKRIGEPVNKKPYVPEDGLQDAFEDME